MIIPFGNSAPSIDATAFLSDGVMVIGDVAIGAESSVWFGSVVRGDVNYVRIGSRTNIQDGCVIHVTHDAHATEIGNEVTIGHRAVLHGCRIGDRCLIGIGAIILDGVEVGDDTIVAAGSLLAPRSKFPPGSLIIGAPAQAKRPLSAEEIMGLRQSATNYVNYSRLYRDQLGQGRPG